MKLGCLASMVYTPSLTIVAVIGLAGIIAGILAGTKIAVACIERGE